MFDQSTGNANSKIYDVVTLGETMLRLTPPAFKRIEQATTLDIEVGGSESNTAIGLTRLELKVAWLSRLTENPLGYLINKTIAGYGVDISWVTWTKEDRVGLYFLEEGKAPRNSSVTYDRAGSAFSRMKPADLPLEMFMPGRASLLHLTGITPATGKDAEATAQYALDLAKAAGWKISFDLNYRATLWSPQKAARSCDYFASKADILLAPINDVRLLYELPATYQPSEVLADLVQRYPTATVVLTLGKDGALGQTPLGKVLHQPVFRAEEVGRFGGGDAFAAGFLYSYLAGLKEGAAEWLTQALRWGAAVAAHKYTIPGDIPVIDRSEVAKLVAQTDFRLAQGPKR